MSRALEPAEAHSLGTERESWCAVEMKKEQDWCRATRKHFPEQFKSTVFNSRGGPRVEDAGPRCTFKVNTPTHRERKHYDSKYVNQLKL